MTEYVDLWAIVLNPVFLITAGLVVGGFAPLLYSIWRTWMAADDASHGSADGLD